MKTNCAPSVSRGWELSRRTDALRALDGAVRPWGWRGGGNHIFKMTCAPSVYTVQNIRCLVFSQTRSPGVLTTSLGPVFRPESFFDGPGAR